MRRVSRLPRDPGPAAWNALLPPPSPPRILDGSIGADWLVVGGGFAGLAAARRLAQLRGADRIALLEARRIGDGPAGRNSGFMIDLPHKLTSEAYAGAANSDQAQTQLNRAAIDFAADAAAEYELSDEAFARSGKVNGAASWKGEAANRAYARHLHALDEPYETLDAEEMRRLTGSSYYRCGLFTPGAAMIQPAMFVRGVASGLAERVDIYEESPVVSFRRDGATWRVKTSAGDVETPRILLAVNGHAESFGYFRRRQVHIHLYASMTRALDAQEIGRLGGATRWGVTPSDPMGSTVRRISGVGGDRITVRNSVTYDPTLETSGDRVEKFGRRHNASFAARFPQLAGVEMAYRWGGRLCLSLNDVPAFGEIDEGVFSACCQNGLGTTRGTIAGMMAAELAANGDSPLLPILLNQDPPKRLPPEPVAWLGAVATLKWREFMAGAEV